MGKNKITTAIGLAIVMALVASGILLWKGSITAEGFAGIVAATTAGAAGLGFVFAKDYNG